MATRCFWPPDSCHCEAMLLVQKSYTVQKFLSLLADFFLITPLSFDWPQKSDLQDVQMWKEGHNFWKTIPIFWRIKWKSFLLPVMGLPSRRISPPWIVSKPWCNMWVDFPQPEEPRITTTSPCLTSKEMPLRISLSPKGLFSNPWFVKCFCHLNSSNDFQDK